MSAGDYTDRITRYTLSKTKDSRGGAVESYTAGAKWWAKVETPTGSRDSVLRSERNTERATVRIRQRVPVKSGDRLWNPNTNQFWQVESFAASDDETVCDCWLFDGINR